MGSPHTTQGYAASVLRARFIRSGTGLHGMIMVRTLLVSFVSVGDVGRRQRGMRPRQLAEPFGYRIRDWRLAGMPAPRALAGYAELARQLTARPTKRRDRRAQFIARHPCQACIAIQ